MGELPSLFSTFARNTPGNGGSIGADVEEESGVRAGGVPPATVDDTVSQTVVEAPGAEAAVQAMPDVGLGSPCSAKPGFSDDVDDCDREVLRAHTDAGTIATIAAHESVDAADTSAAE